MGPIVGNSYSHHTRKNPANTSFFTCRLPFCEPGETLRGGVPGPPGVLASTARLLKPGDGSASRQKYMLSTHDPTLRHGATLH